MMDSEDISKICGHDIKINNNNNILPEEFYEKLFPIALIFDEAYKHDQEVAIKILGAILSSTILCSANNIDEAMHILKETYKNVEKHIIDADKKLNK